MITVLLILVISTGLFFFYLQATCQRILRREFEQDFFRFIVKANSLEFPLVRKDVETFGAPANYPLLARTLKCDFLALAYLVKNAANISQRYSYQERLLMLYFRLVFASLTARHWLKWGVAPATLKLTAVLEYFANVVGERVTTVAYGKLKTEDVAVPLRP
jgi:hypothetical protein